MEVKKLYFLYVRNESGLIGDFIPNIFEEEVEDYKKTMFSPDEKVEMMEEESFRMIHSREYFEDFYTNWTDYVVSLLDKFGYDTDIHNPDVPHDDYEKTISYDINKDVVDVINFCVITRDNDNICVRFDIEANPIDVAFIMQQLIKLTETVFKVVIDEYVHATIKGNEAIIYYGEDAVVHYFDEKLLKYELN